MDTLAYPRWSAPIRADNPASVDEGCHRSALSVALAPSEVSRRSGDDLFELMERFEGVPLPRQFLARNAFGHIPVADLVRFDNALASVRSNKLNGLTEGDKEIETATNLLNIALNAVSGLIREQGPPAGRHVQPGTTRDDPGQGRDASHRPTRPARAHVGGPTGMVGHRIADNIPPAGTTVAVFATLS